jgi:hypothetical protein
MSEAMGIGGGTARRDNPDNCIICEVQRRLNIIYWLRAGHAQQPTLQ